MAYEYEIAKIKTLVTDPTIDQDSLDERLWDILDDIDSEAYERGKDSVHVCFDCECYS